MQTKTVLAMTAAFVMGALVTFATIETVGPQALPPSSQAISARP